MFLDNRFHNVGNISDFQTLDKALCTMGFEVWLEIKSIFARRQ